MILNFERRQGGMEIMKNEHGDAVELLKRLADQFAEGPSNKAWEEMSDSINWFLASLELAECAKSESTEKQNE